MDKTGRSEFKRKFLIDGLPPPLTPASRHIQIFDNYLLGTNLRLRKMREPYENRWTFILQRILFVDNAMRVAEIYLDDTEVSLFQGLEGGEIRKNRYFHEFDMSSVVFDVYLGDLSGLVTAQVPFEAEDRMTGFVPPPFCKIEITNEPSYREAQLVGRSFADLI